MWQKGKPFRFQSSNKKPETGKCKLVNEVENKNKDLRRGTRKTWISKKNLNKSNKHDLNKNNRKIGVIFKRFSK